MYAIPDNLYHNYRLKRETIELSVLDFSVNIVRLTSYVLFKHINRYKCYLNWLPYQTYFKQENGDISDH